MAVITGSDYLAIATAYANARDTMLSAVDYFYDAVYTIVLLDQVVPTIELLGEFYTAYVVNTARLQNTLTLESAVRVLESHVTRQSTEKDLNDYLATHVPGGVPASWAALSQSVGYPIDSGNIA